MHTPTQRHRSLCVAQAAAQAPVLSALMQRLQLAQACMNAIRPEVPAPLRSQLQSAVVDEDGAWCVLCASAATAAKARQLLPLWLQALQTNALPVRSITLRVRRSS